MTIAIDFREDIQARLQQKAAAAGVDVCIYAAQVLEADVLRASWDDALLAARETFKKSGMSNEDLAELIEKEKHEARERRNGKTFRE